MSAGHGVDRDHAMARHEADRIQIAYAPDTAPAEHALGGKAATPHAMGMSVHLTGDVTLS